MFPGTFKGKVCGLSGCGLKLPAAGTCLDHGCGMAASCDTQGALIPLAYSPYAVGISEEQPIIDLVATRAVRKGVRLSFRFYAQTEGYLSSNSITLSFVLTQNLFPGRFIRLTVNATSSGNNFTSLYARVQNQTIWTQIAAPTGNPIRPEQANVYVFLGQYSGCGCVPSAPSPVCAIGLSTPPGSPVLPPNEVLSCKYSFAPLYTGVTAFVGLAGIGVQGNWDFGMWQLAKWGTWENLMISDYVAYVDSVEDALVLESTPGQLLPIGFKPYLQNLGTPLQYGQLAVVVTRRVDVGTNIYLYPNQWNAIDAAVNYGFQWSYPMPNLDPPSVADVIPLPLEPGTVIYMSNLGTAGNVFVTVGVLIKGALSSTFVNISNVSLYSIIRQGDVDDGEVVACTGVYNCSYMGPVPRNLTAGEDMRKDPWLVAGGIIGGVSGSPCIKTMGALHVRERLNHEPLTIWIDQLPPAFLTL